MTRSTRPPSSQTRTIGCSSYRVMLRHILPNVISPALVYVFTGMVLAILIGATLSYLGLGPQPPTPEWGAMLSDARSVMQIAPHAAMFPGCAILLSVLGLNLLGDGLRDALDPRLRSQR